MGNKENLIPNERRTPTEVRENARKGGIKSGESRRRKKNMREWLEIALSTNMKDKAGDPIVSPDTGKPMTREEAGMLKLAAAFANGDIKSIQLAAELLGERIVKSEVTGKDGAPLFPEKDMTLDEINDEIERLDKIERLCCKRRRKEGET